MAIPSTVAPSIILVRHGSTNFNDSDNEKIRGLIDVPLNAQGREEATRAAESLKGTQASEIVTSPLQRAADTAKAIAKVVPARVVYDHRLLPWHTGDLSGHLLSEVRPVLQASLDDPTRPLPGGESFNDFVARLREALTEIAQRSHAAGKPAIVVTSHSNMLSLPSVLFDHPPKTVSDGPPRPGETFRLPIPEHLLAKAAP